MDKLIVYETDRGRYAVRPMSWAGIWNEKGQIRESLNHSALFIEKEDAEKFVEWKNAEEQGSLLKLPDIPKGEYGDAIQLACEELIKRKDCLKAVLVQYDSLVKQQMGNYGEMELPYWCYGFGKPR